jgi:tripartite-type tricarboxylate transporter receptor subunit TctC
MNRREFIGGVSAFALSGVAGTYAAGAQEIPTGSIRFVTPYPPGAGADSMVRRLSQELEKNTGRTLIVDNIGGAGGISGMRTAAQAAPDGKTIVMGLTAQWAVNPSLFDQIPYDSQKSFTPISLLASAPYLLVVHPDLGVKTFAQFLDLMKKNPGKYQYASAGNGSGAHLAMEMLKIQAGLNITHVPYRGAALAFPDVISGRVPITFSTNVGAGPHIKSGAILPLAMTSLQRSEQLPDIPAIAETFPGFSADVWYLVSAPAGTPKPIIDKYNEEFRKVVANPAVVEQFKADAIKIIGSSPADAAAFLDVELAKWTKVVRAANIKPD